MLKNITYRNKNKYLLGVFLLGIFLIYFLSIKNTLQYKTECSELEERLSTASGAEGKIVGLQAKLKEFDNIIMQEEDTALTSQQQLLGIVTDYCQSNQTVLRDFPQSKINRENEFVVETNVFTLEGRFLKILDLIYQFEQKQRIGKVASVDFKSVKDIRTKSLTLNAAIYIQNIRKSNE